MSKPSEVTLSKKQQQIVLKLFKTTTDARKIAKECNLKRHQVMLFLEQAGLKSYSHGSYC